MSYRYIGNKTRFLPTLLSVIRDLVRPGATVADLMCGTAAVSEALRRGGYRVVASDIMTYAVQHATVRLTLTKPPDFAGVGGPSYPMLLAELHQLPPVQGLMYREYSPAGAPRAGCAPRSYLSPANAAHVDAINARLGEWEREGRLTSPERALLRHDLILAVNRVANIAGTYGHFRSKWGNGALSPLTLLPSEFVPEQAAGHRILQGRAEDVSTEIAADLCYLDPPYTKRQYAANYHLIETLARGDEPEAVGVSGLRPWRDQYSNFCSKLRLRDAFRVIITSMHCSHYLISYSADGLLSKAELHHFLSQFGKVELMEFDYPRFRSNDSPLGLTGTEYLFHLVRCQRDE